jgi:hypothetical protein
MLTNRPTVARASLDDIRLIGRIPTRAHDPRTEMTRPKELAEVAVSIWESRLLEHPSARLSQAVTAKTVKPSGIAVLRVRILDHAARLRHAQVFHFSLFPLKKLSF